MDNSNDVDRSEWTKAINGIGVTGFTEEMIKELFDAYDTNGNGKIEYKEFISSLFGTSRVQVTEAKTVKQEIQDLKSGKNNKEFSKTKK